MVMLLTISDGGFFGCYLYRIIYIDMFIYDYIYNIIILIYMIYIYIYIIVILEKNYQTAFKML